MRRIIDQLGREIIYPENPKRIVSLVPSQTELLVDLGLRESIVGITKFCVHPKKLRKEKMIVGGTKKVNFDRIVALNPDVVLCNKEENTAEMVRELEKVAPVHVSDIKDIPGSLEMIRQYGEIFRVEGKALEIQNKIDERVKAFQKFIKEQPKRKVAYFIWKNPWMVAGKETFIDYLLELNKFENVFPGEGSRYPEIELSALKDAQVDLVLLSTEPFPFKNKHRDYLQEQFPECRIEIVDGEYFSWYGSRLMKAFEYFTKFHLSLLAS